MSHCEVCEALDRGADAGEVLEAMTAPPVDPFTHRILGGYPGWGDEVMLLAHGEGWPFLGVEHVICPVCLFHPGGESSGLG